jgi:hypothetical protein
MEIQDSRNPVNCRLLTETAVKNVVSLALPAERYYRPWSAAVLPGLFPQSTMFPTGQLNVQLEHRPPRRFEPVDGILLPRLPVSPSVKVSISKDSVMFCHVNGSLSKNIGEMAWRRYRGDSLVTWEFSTYSAKGSRYYYPTG